jgi:hypothetical protein
MDPGAQVEDFDPESNLQRYSNEANLPYTGTRTPALLRCLSDPPTVGVCSLLQVSLGSPSEPIMWYI